MRITTREELNASIVRSGKLTINYNNYIFETVIDDELYIVKYDGDYNDSVSNYCGCYNVKNNRFDMTREWSDLPDGARPSYLRILQVVLCKFPEINDNIIVRGD